MNNIAQWQKDFYSAPAIYEVQEWYDGEYQQTGNIYDSEEAAQIEVDWHKERKRRARIVKQNIHNLDLSQRRWNK